MNATLLLAAALAASSAQPAPQASGANVAFEELAQNRSHDAISRLLAAGAAESRDPAVLINLGTAYARTGQKERALAMFRAAIASPERYDLQLADGRWMDSRAAARLAAAALDKTDRMVLR
jgi:hypothetical protein